MKSNSASELPAASRSASASDALSQGALSRRQGPPEPICVGAYDYADS